MTSLPRAALAAVVGLLAFVPLAAAHDGCSDHPILVDHYLKMDDKALGLSYLAPSAASATTWSVQVRTGTSKTVTMAFPSPAFEIDEKVDVTGRIKIESRLDRSNPLPSSSPFTSYPRVTVDLVEGERSTLLLKAYYASGEFDLKGSYPGHGPGGAPHTHGDGTDAARGLLTSDLKIRLTFDVPQNWNNLPPLSQDAYTISVHVDGKTFLRLAKAGEAPAPAATPTPAASTTETAPPANNNTTAAPHDGSARSGQPSSAGPASAPAPRVLSAVVDQVGAPMGVALSMVIATAGVGILLWRRRSH